VSVIWEVTTKEESTPLVTLLTLLKAKPEEAAEKNTSDASVGYAAAAKAG
jgi:hypothetical protein